MTVQQGLSGQTDSVWGAVQKIPGRGDVPAGSGCQLGGEFDKRDQDGRLLSRGRGGCAPRRGGQRPPALTAGPPLLWQDTQGWSDPTLPAAARKTGQSGSDPGGFTGELGWDTHRPSGRRGRAGRVGPGCPAGPSRLPGAVTPTRLSSPPREPGLAGRRPRRGGKSAGSVGGSRFASWKPAQPRGGLGPPLPTVGDLAERAAPRARTALQWACREAARLHAGERGCGCSSDYKEAAPIAGRSAAAGFQVPAAPEKLWTCTDFLL